MTDEIARLRAVLEAPENTPPIPKDWSYSLLDYPWGRAVIARQETLMLLWPQLLAVVERDLVCSDWRCRNDPWLGARPKTVICERCAPVEVLRAAIREHFGGES